MIDPDKLPSTALIDSGVFILSQGQRPDDPKAPICREFWAEMLRTKRDILIATPTVTEVMRHTTEYPPVPIPSVAHVMVVGFDQRAAIWLAEKLPEAVIRNEMKPGVFKDYLRYDALILACAARYDATLVTLDEPLHKLAAVGGVACKLVTDFEKDPPPEPRQRPLRFTPQEAE